VTLYWRPISRFGAPLRRFADGGIGARRGRRRGFIQNLYAVVSGAIARLESASDVNELCELAAREVRELAGLDKVMIYLFDATWNGLVVAEARAPDMDTYLGLRFPASDIPRQARDLYLRNKVRLICDVHATPVPIIPIANPQTNRSLDLSYSALRSVSPIHIEYLKNMGVGASMSVSIVREGKVSRFDRLSSSRAEVFVA
jgi:light-regulated signal transduction histidine kinase (bacteriophytochrome)